MKTRRYPIAHRLRVFMTALFLGLVASASHAATDPKADLIAALKGANVTGYFFGYNEDANQTTSALTNYVLTNPLPLPKGDTDLILRYTGITDNQTRTTSTYRSEIVKKGTALTLVITDVGTGKVFEQKPLPAPGFNCSPQGLFANLNDCLDHFRCNEIAPYECQADSLCDFVVAPLTCCLTDGTAISVHMIVRPRNTSSLYCKIHRDVLPDFGDLVLTDF